jgi:uncharacterized protein YoxC
LISAALAIVCGGAGAWAYERFLAQPTGGNPAEAPTAQGRDSETSKTLARVDERIQGLSDQYNSLSQQNKQLQDRLEAMLKAAAPDLAPIEEKVARVGQLSQQVEAIGKQVAPLHEQVAQYAKKVTELDAKLDEVLREASTAPERVPGRRGREGSPSGADRAPTSEGPEGAPAATENAGASVDQGLESGIGQFREKRYRDAYRTFRRLLISHPDDARIWYYSALAYGLGSNDWGRITESMAEEGVSREKASHPPKSAIDSALAGLTKETGKEWIDAYRQRAR